MSLSNFTFLESYLQITSFGHVSLFVTLRDFFISWVREVWQLHAYHANNSSEARKLNLNRPYIAIVNWPTNI